MTMDTFFKKNMEESAPQNGINIRTCTQNTSYNTRTSKI